MNMSNASKGKRAKALIATAGMVAILSAGLVACSPSGNADSDQGSSDAIDKSAYPAHTENMESGAGMASYHAALGYDCVDCHVGDLDGEVAGIVEAGTIEIDGAELPLTSAYYTDNETCLSCHGGSWDELSKLTADLGDYNPHDSIHGTVQYCNECHKGHSEQVDICGECHPNGGQTMKSILAN